MRVCKHSLINSIGFGIIVVFILAIIVFVSSFFHRTFLPTICSMSSYIYGYMDVQAYIFPLYCCNLGRI